MDPTQAAAALNGNTSPTIAAMFSQSPQQLQALSNGGLPPLSPQSMQAMQMNQPGMQGMGPNPLQQQQLQAAMGQVGQQPQMPPSFATQNPMGTGMAMPPQGLPSQ
jgi:hypothetical protein